MTIKEFIEKAFEGGWKNELPIPAKCLILLNLNESDILLDPLAWQAVGKVEGWPEHNHLKRYGEEYQSYFGRMHRFIDALCDGKDLEDALNEATV